MQGQMQERLAVVVREGLKGNHFLFAPDDLAAACLDAELGRAALPPVDRDVARELGGVGVKLARAGSIDEVRSHIGHLSPACRAALARLYLRFLARVAAANTEAN